MGCLRYQPKTEQKTFATLCYGLLIPIFVDTLTYIKILDLFYKSSDLVKLLWLLARIF